MEKGIEFSLTRPDADALELSEMILDVEPPDGFKLFNEEVLILP